MAFDTSDTEAVRISLSQAGPIPNATLYNNGKDLWAGILADGVSVEGTPIGPAGGDLAGTYPDPTLVPTGTAGTYTKVTTDSKGRVASGTTLIESDIPSLSPSKITGTAVITTDSRLSDARIPTGTAGGDIAGTYPNPTLAAAGTAGTYTKVTTDTKGRVTSGTTLAASDMSSLLATSTPLPIGIASAGTATTASRSDHVHAGPTSLILTPVQSPIEVASIVNVALTGTYALYAKTSTLWLWTVNASGNWTLNVTGDAAPSTLNNTISIGQSITITALVPQAATPFYQTAFQIDGVANTPKWQGGVAPTSGNASSTDVYTFTILKTANATFTTIAARTRFA